MYYCCVTTVWCYFRYVSTWVILHDLDTLFMLRAVLQIFIMTLIDTWNGISRLCVFLELLEYVQLGLML